MKVTISATKRRPSEGDSEIAAVVETVETGDSEAGSRTVAKAVETLVSEVFSMPVSYSTIATGVA
jgi:hypothetical protein